jgi:hypothetical protein
MVRDNKNKRAAMEMTVGTIVTIVLLMSALVLGLILTKTIFGKTTENVENIDAQVKGEINDLFGEEGTGFVIRLGNQNTARVRQGTQNFGIPIGFSPTDPNAWGTGAARGNGCTYKIEPSTQTTYCIGKVGGWNTVAKIKASVITGTDAVKFESFENNNGYSLIKMNIPEDVPPCLQRFSIVVTCNGPTFASETVKGAFDIEVLKKGIF